MKKSRKKRPKLNPWAFLASAIIFTVGAGIFLYPIVSDHISKINQSNVINSYQAQVDNMDEERLSEEWERALIYNENLSGDPVHDPFVPGSGYILPDGYDDILNLDGNGVMCYLSIPKINVNLPVYHGTSEDVLEKGAGHLESTALPVGGNNRNPVISAHRGLPSAELFTRLDELVEGDVFYIHILESTLAYKVYWIATVEPDELENLTAERDKDTVTLLTCTPYAVNTHRLLVRGERIEYNEDSGSEEAVKKPETNPDVSGNSMLIEKNIIFICLLILSATVIIIICVRNYRRKRQRRSWEDEYD